MSKIVTGIMKCLKCKFNNPEGANFCNRCGSSFTDLQMVADFDARLHALRAFIPEILADKIKRSKGKIEGERRFITVMFADISGFTALSEKLDPEDITTIMNDRYRELAKVVYKHEGMIDKIIGDCLMVIFGVPVAHENDPERAVKCALEMQDVVQKVALDPKFGKDIKITLHIGINSGWVVAGVIGSDLRMDYTVVGDTVNLASRLESVAERETILVSKRTAELVKGIAEMRRLKPLKLKGKSKSIVAYEVMNLLRRPISQRSLAIRSEMVGREKELTLLKDRLSYVARTKKGRVLFITGEAGIGKSRLVEEFGRYALNSGFLCIQGHCLSYGETISFRVFIEMLRSVFGIWETVSEKEIRKKVMIRLKKLIPNRFADVYPYILSLLQLDVEEQYRIKVEYLDPKALRLAQFCAVRDLFSALAEKKSIVLIFEDWHWVDASSTEFLEFLINTFGDSLIMLLVVLRPEKDSHGYRVMNKVKKQSAEMVDVILLEHLDEEYSTQLITNLAKEIPKPLQELILKKSNGNPFFVEEIIRSLVDNKTLQFESNSWIVLRNIDDIEIPDRIELLISSRIDRLTSELRYILQAASVIGFSFYKKILQYITNIVERKLDSHLERLQEREFIFKELPTKILNTITEMEYIFKHPLIQEAAYAGLLKKKRRDIHKRICECIEDIYKNKMEEFYGFFAHHFREAEDWDRSLFYCVKAGDYAKQRYHNEEALKLYEVALQISDNVKPNNQELRMKILSQRGSIFISISQYKNALNIYQTLLKEAQTADDQQKEIEALCQIGMIHLYMSELDQAVEVTNKCLELAIAEDNKSGIASCYHTLGVVYADRGEYNKALEYYNKALNLKKILKDNDSIAMTLSQMGIFFENTGDFMKALNYHEKAKQLFDKAHNRRRIGASINNIGIIYLHMAEYTQALSCFQKANQIFSEIGERLFEANSLGNMATVHFYAGNHKQALDLFFGVLKIFTDVSNQCGVACTLNMIGSIYEALSDYEKALRFFHELQEISQNIGSRRLEAVACLNRGIVYTDLGDYGSALKYLDQSMKIATAINEQNLQAECLCGIGTVYYDQNNLDEAYNNYSEALLIAQSIKSKRNELYTLLNICKVHYERNEKQQAISKLEKVFNWAQDQDDKKLKADSLLLRAMLLANNNLEEAFKCLDTAINIADSTCDYDLLWRLYSQKGELLFRQGDNSMALEFFRKCEKIFTEVCAKMNNPKMKDSYLDVTDRKKVIDYVEILKERIKSS